MQARVPDRLALEQVFRIKYGPPESCGWGPAMRWRAGYFGPDDWYEALVASLVVPGTAWLDVGSGRDLFPGNQQLAAILAARAGRLCGIDPSPNLQDNPFVRERVQGGIDTWDGGASFDLVTLRMVAEHVQDPDAAVRGIARALKSSGAAVIYTVCAWSPAPLLTRITPMELRHKVKSFLWGTEPRDTFPTCFRMNTRQRLRLLFSGAGMREELFLRLDDCRTTGRFRVLNQIEIDLRGLCRAVRLPYPEHCLLGVYRKS
jgi:SAM-dependent methyltransferase